METKTHTAKATYARTTEAINRHTVDIKRGLEMHRDFFVGTESRDWGRVGDIADIEIKLRDIADRINNRGEYALDFGEGE